MLNPVVSAGAFTELDKFMFESWGYFVIPNVLSKEEVKECLQASIRLHEAAGTVGWGQVGRGYESEHALENLMDHPSVLPKIRGLLGDRFIMQSGWNTMQPARGGWEAGIKTDPALSILRIWGTQSPLFSSVHHFY